jgi:hypothetical protein
VAFLAVVEVVGDQAEGCARCRADQQTIEKRIAACGDRLIRGLTLAIEQTTPTLPRLRIVAFPGSFQSPNVVGIGIVGLKREPTSIRWPAVRLLLFGDENATMTRAAKTRRICPPALRFYCECVKRG